MRASLFYLIVSVASASSLEAQRPSVDNAAAMKPSPVRTAIVFTAADIERSGRRSPRATPVNRFLARAALGSIGWSLGALAGGAINFAASDCDEPHQPVARCEYPANVYLGAALGGVVLTGVTIGAIAMRDGCDRKSRLLFAMAGATAGTLAGLLADNWQPNGSIPFATVLGSTVLAGACRST